MAKLFSFILLCLVPLLVEGRQDSLQNQADAVIMEDSIASNSAQKIIDLLSKTDSLSLTDSITAVVLNKQLAELRSYEKSKRRALENQLAEIKKADSIRQAEMQAEIVWLKKAAVGYPVVVDSDTILTIYTKIGSLTPAERAALITERLSRVYEIFLVNTDTIQVVNNGSTADLFFNDKVLLSITELDALWFERDKLAIAEEYSSNILADIFQYKRNHSLLKYAKEFGTAALVVLIQILLIIGINRLFRRYVTQLLWSKRGVWFKGIKIKNQEIINESRQASAMIFLSRLVKYSIILIILYLTLPIVFLLFPLTERFALAMFSYVLNPLKTIGAGLINYLPELVSIIVIVTITRYLLMFLKYLSKELETENLHLPGFYPDWSKPTYNIVKILILAFMFVVIFPYLPGSDSAVFKGVSVFLGLVFSLGSTSIIGNLMAGLVITYMRPFRLGDHIKVGETMGIVVEKTAFATRVRTLKKEYITVPNSNILSSNVINYSNSELQGGLVIHTTVTIGYDVPWRQVQQILINAAKKTANLNLEIAPFVLQTSLDDFYVAYQLNAHTNEPNKQPTILNELHQNIQDGFKEANIEILSPHYRAERDGNPLTIPPDLPDPEEKKEAAEKKAIAEKKKAAEKEATKNKDNTED
jgi:small-conductance mechanosensitive channel